MELVFYEIAVCILWITVAGPQLLDSEENVTVVTYFYWRQISLSTQ